MPHRTVKQARSVLQYFIHEICDDKIPRAINSEKFILFVAGKTGWELEVEVISNMAALRGLLLRNDSTKEALMLVSDGNTPCWKRFTSIKESCHFFLQHDAQVDCDNALEMAQALVLHTAFMPELLPPNSNCSQDHEAGELDFTIPLVDQIASEISSKHASGSSSPEEALVEALSKINPHGVAESAAIVAAIEIMIPEHHHVWLTKRATTSTLFEMANELKVPKLILEYRLNGWGVTPRVSSKADG